jgi:hypothetical protein
MNDDRVLSALKRLGGEELPTVSDRAIRRRLETAWTAGARPATMPRFVQRFAPALAAVMLIGGFAGTAVGASADSPLWDTRVALEAAGAAVRTSNDDRVAYLLELVRSRTEEAARQDAAGHPGAAVKARAAASAAVAQLDGDLPQISTAVPTPATVTPPPATPSASVMPAVEPSSSPSPARTVAPLPPTPVSTPTPTPVRTETMRPPSPSPSPSPTRTATPTATGTKQSATITGTVRDASGANVTNACITTSSMPPTSTTACTMLTKNGSYGFTVTLMPGQTITLFAYYTDPVTGALSSGYATGTAASPTTVMPAITLTLRR